MLATALIVVLIATGLLNMAIRSQDFVALTDAGRLARHLTSATTLTRPTALDGMVVNTDQASTLVAVAQFVTANTSPGEAVFVYPTSPLVYLLANRPNPTRFDHLHPGAASATELNRLIETLDHAPVNLAVVSESDLTFWGPPAGNAPLEAYLVGNYHEIAQFGSYRVLRRD